ncbi:hypothetical protein P7C73_g5197, partial [Tremellales sp. Uapishka_1]
MIFFPFNALIATRHSVNPTFSSTHASRRRLRPKSLGKSVLKPSVACPNARSRRWRALRAWTKGRSGDSGVQVAMHRAQKDHACSAPEAGSQEARDIVRADRKAKARALLARTFPETLDRVIPKPPPGRDVVRKKEKSPERLPPSLLPEVEKQVEPAEVEKKGKTKEEKVYEMHVARPKDVSDTTQVRPLPPSPQYHLILSLFQNLNLLCLSGLPGSSRTIKRLDFAQPASRIPQASLVVLVRGAWPS